MRAMQCRMDGEDRRPHARGVYRVPGGTTLSDATSELYPTRDLTQSGLLDKALGSARRAMPAVLKRGSSLANRARIVQRCNRGTMARSGIGVPARWTRT